MNFTESISDVIPPQKVTAIMVIIERSEKIVITTHLSPDGDALGSSLALYHYLKGRGKQVRIIVPNSFPYFLKWMQGACETYFYDYNTASAQHRIPVFLTDLTLAPQNHVLISPTRRPLIYRKHSIPINELGNSL